MRPRATTIRQSGQPSRLSREAHEAAVVVAITCIGGIAAIGMFRWLTRGRQNPSRRSRTVDYIEQSP
jgi:hypothetical protein